MVMLAGFQLLLKQYTGQNDIFVGSVSARWPRVELEPLIGMFINPLVLRTHLSGDPSFRDCWCAFVKRCLTRSLIKTCRLSALWRPSKQSAIQAVTPFSRSTSCFNVTLSSRSTSRA